MPLDRLQPIEQVLAFGDRPLRIDMRMADHAGRIDQKHRARVHAAFVVENAVGLADRAVRPVIGQQRKWQTAQLFGPGLEAGNGVGADLQNLDVKRFELLVVLTEPGYLILSSAGKRKRQKGNHRLAAAKARKLERIADVRSE